jgi:hypothetical protein
MNPAVAGMSDAGPYPAIIVSNIEGPDLVGSNNFSKFKPHRSVTRIKRGADRYAGVNITRQYYQPTIRIGGQSSGDVPRWRVTFRFEGNEFVEVKIENYH